MRNSIQTNAALTLALVIPAASASVLSFDDLVGGPTSGTTTLLAIASR